MLIILAPASLFFFVGSYKVFFPRNLVAVLPFLCLFAGIFMQYSAEFLEHKLNKHRRSGWRRLSMSIIALMISLTIFQQLMISVQHLNRITLPDTRWISLQWIDANLPENASIGREHYTPPIRDTRTDFMSFTWDFLVRF